MKLLKFIRIILHTLNAMFFIYLIRGCFIEFTNKSKVPVTVFGSVLDWLENTECGIYIAIIILGFFHLFFTGFCGFKIRKRRSRKELKETKPDMDFWTFRIQVLKRRH